MAFHKRKQFWIDAPLQLQMLGYVLALVAASLLLVSFSVLRGLDQASAQSRQIFHSLDWVHQTIRGPLVLSSCLSILAAGLLTLIWSHRFAGPLRVLSAGMARLRQGNLSAPTKIRATDTHQELLKEFSAMQESLRLLLQNDRRGLEKAAQKIHDAAGHVSGETARRQLLEASEELKTIGSHFQL